MEKLKNIILKAWNIAQLIDEVVKKKLQVFYLRSTASEVWIYVRLVWLMVTVR